MVGVRQGQVGGFERASGGAADNGTRVVEQGDGGGVGVLPQHDPRARDFQVHLPGDVLAHAW